MNENEEQNKPVSQTAEAEKVLGEKEGLLSLGKFKDVNALLNAYNSLEAEFTKRSQRLKELEGKINLDKANQSLIGVNDGTSKENVTDFTQATTETAPNVSLGEDENNLSKTQEEIASQNKDEILKEYLKEVLSNKQKAVIMDGVGVGVKAPTDKPKSITEAGNLVKAMFLSK